MDAQRSIGECIRGLVLPWTFVSMLGGLLCPGNAAAQPLAPVCVSTFELAGPVATILHMQAVVMDGPAVLGAVLLRSSALTPRPRLRELPDADTATLRYADMASLHATAARTFSVQRVTGSDFAPQAGSGAPTPWPLPPIPSTRALGEAFGTAFTHLLLCFIGVFVALIAAYSARHYVFALSRLYIPQRAPYRAILDADWPMLTVFVAAHNEEAVVADCLQALLRTTYPHDRLTIVPVNDRSTDATREIIDSIAVTAPGLIHPFHRTSGKPGKAAALKDALRDIRTDIMIVFDADYLPRPSLLKELVAPFFDPEVGAVMGRVVPQNAGTNLLTRLLDLERAGGYQVNQQARMAMGLVPQYGGTVGGLRKSALDEAGGWRDDTLAEDTDMTYRMLLKGWRTAYLNYAECYEEVPERWPTRKRQLTRWAKGHNQTMLSCTVPLLRERSLHPGCQLDGVLLLGVYLMPALLALAWAVAALLYFMNVTAPVVVELVLTLVALFALSAFGNFGVFFEIVVAARLDGHARRIRIMPLNALGFCVTIASVTHALSGLVLDAMFKRELKWDKTERFRRPVPATTTGLSASIAALSPVLSSALPVLSPGAAPLAASASSVSAIAGAAPGAGYHALSEAE